MTISGSFSLDTGTLGMNNHALTISSGGSLTFGGASGISGASQISDSGTFDYDGSGTATLGATFNLVPASESSAAATLVIWTMCDGRRLLI